MKNITYRVIVEPDENDTFHAFVPALPGCHTWADSIDEARKMIREAIALHIQTLTDSNEPIPEETGFELFETVNVPV